MYINQLIVGIQLCYIVTSIRELFLFLLSFYFFIFLFIFITSFFFSSFPTYFCCTRRSSAGRALKNPRRNGRRPVLIPCLYFFPFSSRVNIP